MADRVACGSCGALNGAAANFCGQCYGALAGGMPALASATGFSVAAPGVSGLPRGWAPPAPPQVAAGTAHSISAQHRDKAAPLRWKWRHLWLFGALAFGLPAGLAQAWGAQETLSQTLNGALYFQIIGYLLAVGLAVYMVRHIQGGDWTTLGISRDGNIADEVLRGAGFGLLLIAAFLPITFVLAGQVAVEGIVKVLVGATDEMGLALGAVVVLIGAPVIEEIYYRGILYEKLARRNIWLAVVVTSLLFTAAHGAILIPAILLLGFALAWKRRTKTLWYTMAAHGTWNLVVLLLAGWLLLGAGWSFTAPDQSYTVQFPRNWKEISLPAQALPGVKPDIAVETASGAGLVVLRVPAVGGTAEATLKRIMNAIERSNPGLARGAVTPHPHPFDEGAEEIHVVYGTEENGVSVVSIVDVVLAPGASHALVFNWIGPEMSLRDEVSSIDSLFHTIDFAPLDR